MPAAVKAANKRANLKTRAHREDPRSTQAPRELKSEHVRSVDGFAVISDAPLASPLSKRGGAHVHFTGFRQLTLEGGRQVVGCADCETTGTRGEVQKHRYAEHGAGVRRKNQPELPSHITEMTLGQVLALAAASDQWGIQFDNMERSIQEWKKRALAAEEHNRKVTIALNRAGFTLKVGE